MYVRPLDFVLQVIEVLFLSQKHFLLFSFRLDTNDLSVFILDLSSTVFNMLLRLSSQLFILEIKIFNSKFSFGNFLKFLFLCWDSYLFVDYDISSLKSLYILIMVSLSSCLLVSRSPRGWFIWTFSFLTLGHFFLFISPSMSSNILLYIRCC